MTSTGRRITESDLIGLLKDRYCKPGNGGAGEYALLTHVRDAAGFDAKTTIDALALGLWPSRGHLLHGFEVKCSRADWLRELKDPAKAERTASRCDRFWLVTAHLDIVQPGELPATWGHLTVRGNRLAVVREAPALRDEQVPIDHGWLVCLLRAAGATGTRREGDSEIERARREGYDAGLASAADTVERAKKEADYAREDLAKEQERRRRFFALAGLPDVHEWRLDKELPRIGRVVRAVLDGERRVVDAEVALQRALGIVEAQRTQLAQALAEIGHAKVGS